MRVGDWIATFFFKFDAVDGKHLLAPGSPEVTKWIFDSVRNFGLVATVGIAGVFLYRGGDRVPGCALGIATAGLFLLNVFFMCDLIERLEVFHRHRGWVAVSFLLGVLVVAAGGMVMLGIAIPRAFPPGAT